MHQVYPVTKMSVFTFRPFLIFLLSLTVSTSWSQVSLTGNYTQNFDAISGVALPSGWTIAGSTSATLTANGTISSTASGGSYVFISGSDKAIGILNSSGYTSGKTVVFSFQNNTGSIITSLPLSFNYEKYRSGSRAWAWTVTASSGTVPASLNLSYAADAANTSSYFPPLQTAVSGTITGLSIAVGAVYTITWTLVNSPSGNTNGQALGIDDFTITLPNIFISTSPSSISGLDYVFGSGPSTPQMFTVTGTGTTNPLSANLPAASNFEISTAMGGPYSSSLSISSGAKVWVRLKAGLTPNPYSDNVTLGGGGAPDKMVPVSGTVTSAGCTPFITNACSEYISNVNVNTINKTSGCGSTSIGYSNFTSTTTTLSKGTTYSLNISVAAGMSTDDIRAWADWDQDGLFDATERIVYVNNNGGAGAYNFTVPAGAPSGAVTLRIMLVRDNETNPCGPSTYGETEDYTLNVVNACTPVATVSNFYPKSGPAGTIVKIVGSGLTGATVKFNGIDATSVTVISATEINAEVPAGAGTGYITVTDVNGCNNTTTGKFTFLTESGSCTGAGSYTDLLITEISDPKTGNTHYIEVYNGTSSIIDLDIPNNYTLQVFNDPSTTTSDDITGVINPGEVKVYYAGSNGALANGSQSGTINGFNDNDEIRLLKNGIITDRVKTPNYEGYNYKRLNSVTSPNSTYNSAEWTITPEPMTQSTSGIGNYTSAASFNIIQNPVDDVSSCSINLSVMAAPAAGLTYQWKYQNGATGTTWTNLADGTTSLPGATISGATSSSLAISGNLTAYNNYQFYVEVSNGSCTKSSTAAQFTLGVFRNFKSNSPVTGNWTSPSSWLMSSSPTGPWMATCTYPTSANSDTIIIQSGDVITLDASLSLDQLLVNTGGYLKIPSAIALTVENGSPGADLTVLGSLEDGSGTGNSVVFNGTWKIGNAGSFIKTNISGSNVWQAGYETGIANIPSTANWIIRYNGTSTSPSVSSIGAIYPNLIFENTYNTGNWYPTASNSRFVGSSGFPTIKGNLDIGGTGTGTVTATNENTNAQPLKVLGNVIVRSGSTLTNSGAAYGTGFEVQGNIDVAGSLTVNGGSIGLLKLSGTLLQTISGTGNINLQNVTVTNAGGVNILKDLAIGGNLVLTQGIVNPFANMLSIGGIITRSTGVIDGDSATLNMTGSAAQTIPANTLQANNLLNLVISNIDPAGVTLGGHIDLYGKLSFGNGSNKLLTSNGLLTLRSTANGTAMVTDVTNNNVSNVNNAISGNVVVERYYPKRRAWHLVTAPVSNTGSLYKEWQNGGNYIANSGTYITKPFGTGTATDGLEQSLKYSMDTFNTATGKLENVKNSKLTLLSENTVGGTVPANRGYFTFVRGDRVNINLIPPNSSFTTLRDTGLLQTYTKVFTASLPPDTSINKFMLIGNPYASPVNFSKLIRGNVLKRFIAWDPTLNTLGAYVLVDGQAGSYVVTPSPDPMIGTTGQDSVIQSSQAFFVQANAPGNTSVTFNESSKGTEDKNTVFRPAFSSDVVTSVSQSLRANLYLDDGDTTILADGVYQQFSNSYSIAIDNLDGAKFSNILENFGIAKDNKTLILERRPLVKETDTIFFKLWNTTERKYDLRFSVKGLANGVLEGYLEDSYLKTKTPLNLNGYTNVSFTITGDQASKVSDRFMIVFKAVALAPLPVTFTLINAYQHDKDINVEWKVNDQTLVKEYNVERSVNGQDFITSAIVNATTNNSGTANYLWPDKDVTAGIYYYRIKSIGTNGEVRYSNTVRVIISKAISLIAIYPNPVINGNINVHLINQPAGTYYFRLINSLGQNVYSKQVELQEGSNVEILRPGKKMAHGSYHLEILKPDETLDSYKVLY